MDVNFDTLFSRAALYFHGFGPADQMTFIPTSQEAMASSVMAGTPLEPIGGKVFRVPAGAMMKEYDARGFRTPGMGWIHHTGHCGATLLAQLFQSADRALIIDEPLSISQLGSLAGASFDPERAPPKFWPMAGFAMTMLGKRYHADQVLLAKGTVASAVVASAVEQTDPGRPVLLLYHRLENHLRVSLQSNEHLQRIAKLASDLRLSERFDLSGKGPAFAAAGLWLVTMKQLQAVSRANENARAIDALDLFGDFETLGSAAAQHVGLDVTNEAIASLRDRVPEPGDDMLAAPPSSIADATSWAREMAVEMGLGERFEHSLGSAREPLF